MYLCSDDPLVNSCNGCGAEKQEFYGCSVYRNCAPSTYRAVERLTSENDFMKSNRKSQRVKHFLGLIDSGSNCDIVTEEFFLDEAEVQATPIGGVAGKAKSKLKGKVRAWVRGKKSGHGTKQKIVFDSVNHLGEAHCSIFTVSKLTRKGSIVHFEDGNNYILLPDGTRVNMVEKNGLYYIRLEHIASPEEINCMVAMKKPEYRPEILGMGPHLRLTSIYGITDCISHRSELKLSTISELWKAPRSITCQHCLISPYGISKCTCET